jgi:aminoglycoside/choline kinase family phosphotransferase
LKKNTISDNFLADIAAKGPKMENFNELESWLSRAMPQLRLDSMRRLTGDAGLRQYFRINDEHGTFIVVIASSNNEMVSFLKILKFFQINSINVPQIIKMELRQGFMVITDLGEQTLFNIINNANADKFYLQAIKQIIKLQAITEYAEWGLPCMDHSYIRERLRIFKYWFLQKNLNLTIDAQIEQLIANLEEIFIKSFTEQPQMVVHHDFHSRNIMLQDETMSLIDFQDAILGPYSYDLASLLHDSYLNWDNNKISNWMTVYQTLAVKSGVIHKHQLVNFTRDFEIVSLERHLKNLGVFSRLHYRDKKTSYLQHIPTLLQYCVDICNKHEDLSPLNNFLQARVITNLATMEEG